MSASGKGGMPGQPQIGGGPAPIQQPQQPDIYQRYGGQPNVDSDPNTPGYQSPGTAPVQKQEPVTPQQPGLPGSQMLFGGKGGFGPQIGMPVEQQAQFDPTQQQQPTYQPTQATQQNPNVSIGFGGKSGFNLPQ
jgi:hypothetical protein